MASPPLLKGKTDPPCLYRCSITLYHILHQLIYIIVDIDNNYFWGGLIIFFFVLFALNIINAVTFFFLLVVSIIEKTKCKESML